MALMLKTLASAEIRHALVVEVRILEEPGTVTVMRELARTLRIEAGSRRKRPGALHCASTVPVSLFEGWPAASINHRSKR